MNTIILMLCEQGVEMALRTMGIKKPGDDLLFHRLAVPSALEGLTSVFGMGTGVAPPQ